MSEYEMPDLTKLNFPTQQEAKQEPTQETNKEIDKEELPSSGPMNVQIYSEAGFVIIKFGQFGKLKLTKVKAREFAFRLNKEAMK